MKKHTQDSLGRGDLMGRDEETLWKGLIVRKIMECSKNKRDIVWLEKRSGACENPGGWQQLHQGAPRYSCIQNMHSLRT